MTDNAQTPQLYAEGLQAGRKLAAEEIERLREEKRQMAFEYVMAQGLWIEEIERLREALRMIADGNVPRQHVIRWRHDGQLSKHDKCPHDKWMYDDCDECVASFARAALGEKE